MSKLVSQLKEKQRKLFREKIRDEHVKNQALEVSSKKLSYLLDLLGIWERGLIIASYRSLPGELSVEAFQQKYQYKCCFVFPKVKEEKQIMSFASADLNKAEDWERSAWTGAWQPSGHKEVPLQKIDVFLVPALAFDRKGRRLGRGKGFYDRTLSEASGLKIGMGGTYQISNEDLPEQSHDVGMDAVVTESFIFSLLKNGTLMN